MTSPIFGIQSALFFASSSDSSVVPLAGLSTMPCVEKSCCDDFPRKAFEYRIKAVYKGSHEPCAGLHCPLELQHSTRYWN